MTIMRIATMSLCLTTIAAGDIAIAAIVGIDEAVIALPCMFGPFFITLWLSWILRGNPSQAILTLAALCYGAWLTYDYHDIVFGNFDLTGRDVIILMGICVIPVMVPFWLVAFVVRRRRP
jgi:hypothetical protein